MPENVGIIVRTNCRDAQEEEILHELEELMKRYEAVLQKGKSRVCFSVLEKSMPEYVQILQNLYSQDLEEIVTDKQKLYECAVQYLKAISSRKKLCAIMRTSCCRCISCIICQKHLSRRRTKEYS